jgi:hypothetical protein
MFYDLMPFDKCRKRIEMNDSHYHQIVYLILSCSANKKIFKSYSFHQQIITLLVIQQFIVFCHGMLIFQKIISIPLGGINSQIDK